jgi:hypothetical protein
LGNLQNGCFGTFPKRGNLQNSCLGLSPNGETFKTLFDMLVCIKNRIFAVCVILNSPAT